MNKMYEHVKMKRHGFQQGVIFNGALAQDFEGEKVFGLAITPRCDIENKKVPYVHYLPIVSYANWINVYLKDLYRKKSRKSVYDELKGLLKEKRKSPKLLELLKNEEDWFGPEFDWSNSQISKIKKCFHELEDGNVPTDFYRNKKFCKDEIKRLGDGNHSHYYLIEKWSEDLEDSFYVVLLREVRRISFNCAYNIGKGIEIESMGSNDIEQSDICVDEKDVLYVQAMIKSPFIEHIVQSFVHNFGRIGVNKPEYKYDNLINII